LSSFALYRLTDAVCFIAKIFGERNIFFFPMTIEPYPIHHLVDIHLGLLPGFYRDCC